MQSAARTLVRDTDPADLFQIYLDGELLDDVVVEADVDRNFVIVEAKNEVGELRYKTIKGKVRILFNGQDVVSIIPAS